MYLMTYSIIGFDPDEQTWGVAVQSRFLAVGSVVPWAEAGIGAVATQAQINTTYGPNALKLMSEGKTATEALQIITSADPQKWLRQVAIMDKHGQVATFTGKGCQSWAGSITGENVVAIGNRLVNEQTVEALVTTFVKTKAPLAERLLLALEAGQQAGGDLLGQQAAALLVVKESGGFGGFNDRLVDLRVDDHMEPIKELMRLYRMQQLIQTTAMPDQVVPISGNIKKLLVEQLIRLGFLLKNELTEEKINEALQTYIRKKGFFAREQKKGYMDVELLTYMKNFEPGDE